MIAIPTTEVELLTKGTMRSLGNGRYKYVAKCRDLSKDERRTYIWLEVYDQALAQYLKENAGYRSRVRVGGKLKSETYLRKGFFNKIMARCFGKGKKLTAFNFEVTSASVL